MSTMYHYPIPSNINLWLEDDKLRFKAPVKVLDDSALQLLKSNKELFIDIFKKTGSKNITVHPLAQNQKALWFLHQLNPGNKAYNIALAAKIKNGLNYEALTKSLSILFEKHWPLCSIFRELTGSEGVSCQIVSDTVQPFIRQIDCPDMSEEEIRTRVNEYYLKPFDLENGPLFKTFLFKATGYSIVLFCVHHIITDALSLRLLFDELIDVYDSVVGNNGYKIQQTDYDYASYLTDQVDFLNSEYGIQQLSYWKKNLEDSAFEINLPADFDRPEIHRFQGKTFTFEIAGDAYRQLLNAAKENNVTVNVVLFTLFELLLSKVSLSNNFCIGMPVAARTRKEYEQVFGYLINMVAIRCLLDDKKDFTDYISENKSKLYTALENQDIPFPILVEKIAAKRDLSKTPIFQVMFNYLNRKSLGSLMDFLDPSQDIDYKKWGSLEIKPFKIYDQEGQFDLTMEILHLERENKLSCAFKYNSDLFKSERISEFAHLYTGLVHSVANDIHYKPDWDFKVSSTKEKREKDKLPINITGTFTVEPVGTPMNSWFEKLNLDCTINFVGYNQVFQQLYNPTSEFSVNSGGFNILLVRFEDWMPDKSGSYEEVLKSFSEFKDGIVSACSQNTRGKYLLAVCPVSDQIKENKQAGAKFGELEKELADTLKSVPNAVVITTEEILKNYSISDYYEPLGEKAGHIPYKEDFYTVLATIFARKINSYFVLPVKAIAVDCDNTLWEGIVGEDGPLGVRVGPAERALQEFLVAQNKEGIIICLCSKNIEKDVFDVLEQNEQMILKKEHIAFHRINWSPKSENLVSLSKEINIGIDSFVFIDDNPMECAEVKRNLPSVIVIRKRNDDQSAGYLRNSWIFDKMNVTEEDKLRTKRYKDEADRSKYKLSVKSYKEFIEGLNVKITINKVNTSHIQRVSQLTYRTNQFNFTTIRRNETEVTQLVNNERYDCYEIELTDRFGDYGIIGVIFAEKLEEFYGVDTFLLSCRVLGKGVEHSLISYLGNIAKTDNFEYLAINFKKTEKNLPAELFLESNFSSYKKINADGNIIYKVPADFAVQFKFDPDSYKGDSEKEEKTETPLTGITFDIEKRNNLYYDIADNYITLEQINKNLNHQPDLIKPDNEGTNLKGINETGNIILNVWKSVLRKDNISPGDNFFEIGGHSSLIPQIVIKLEREYGIKIEIVNVFQYPTVKMLTGYVSKNTTTTESVEAVNVDSKSRVENMKKQREKFKNLRAR